MTMKFKNFFLTDTLDPNFHDFNRIEINKLQCHFNMNTKEIGNFTSTIIRKWDTIIDNIPDIPSCFPDKPCIIVTGSVILVGSVWLVATATDHVCGNLEKPTPSYTLILTVHTEWEDNLFCNEVNNLSVYPPQCMIKFVDETNNITRLTLTFDQTSTLPAREQRMYRSCSENYRVYQLLFFISEMSWNLLNLDPLIGTMERRIIYKLRLLRKMESFYKHYDSSYQRVAFFRHLEED